MITDIQNFNYKSFKNYSSPKDFFKKKNILFGYNGRGKSSLSEGIIQNFSNQNKVNKNIRFFNRDYVRNQLLLEQTNSTIKGVKVSFSKKDADTVKKIKILEGQIIKGITSRKTEYETARKEIRKKIDKIHDIKKGSANINKKQSKLAIEEVIKQYSIDLKAALKLNKSKDYIKDFKADIHSLQHDKEKITKIQLPNLNIQEISFNDIQFLFETFNKEYTVIEDIPTSEVILWLEKGVSLHSKTDTTCKFCNNNFNLEDVKNLIKTYKENSKQKDIFRLENIKHYFLQNIEILKRANNIKGNLSILGCSDEEINNLFDFNYINYATLLIKSIEEKIINMDKSIEVENSISIHEERVNNQAKRINELHTEKLHEINNSIHNIEKITKGTIAIAIEESDIPDKIKKIQVLEEELKKIEDNNKRINKEIQVLEENKSEYIDFMNFLNDVLSSLGIQIKLILDDKNYYLKHPIEDCELTIDSISEGEKNLLALMYFYFELYSDKEQEKFKPEIELVVIDDPISSLDDSNKFYVLEIVRKILFENIPQVFILTHSWNDFCQITYGIKTKNTEFAFFEIYKNSKNNFQSDIQYCGNNIAPYKKLFQEIHLLKDKNSEELNQCEIYHAANSMRRIFEEFLNFKKPNLLPQKSNQKDIEALFFDATGRELGKNRRLNLGELLTFINVLSHRPIRAEEIVKNSKTLMKIIEDIDKVHFNEMKK